MSQSQGLNQWLLACLYLAFLTVDNLSNTGAPNNINHGCIPFRCSVQGPILAHCHVLLGHVKGAEPLLMGLVPPVLLLLWQVKLCATTKICWCDYSSMINVTAHKHEGFSVSKVGLEKMCFHCKSALHFQWLKESQKLMLSR